jgi:hypothetical protein
MGKKNPTTSLEAEKEKNETVSWKWVQEKSVVIGTSSDIKPS